GVAPPRFVGISAGAAPGVFIPITAYAANEGGGSRDGYFLDYRRDWIEMIVRRQPGVSREVASADLSAAFLQSWNASRLVHPRYGSAVDMRPQAYAGALKTTAGPNPGLEARTLIW